MIYKTILIYSIDCSNKQYKYAIVYFIMNDWKNNNLKLQYQIEHFGKNKFVTLR